MFTDSSVTEALSRNNEVSARVRHIDVTLKVVSNALACGLISLEHIEIAENIEDIHTKILALPTLSHLVDFLRLMQG